MTLTLKSLESLLTSSLSNIDARMNKIDKRIDRMQSDLRCDLNFNVYDRLDILSLKLDAHRKETAERFDEVDERFDRLEARFDNLEARFESLEARFDNLEARFDNLEARFIKLEAEVHGMPRRIMDELANMLWPYLSHNDIKHLEHDRRLNTLETKANFSRRIFYYQMRRKASPFRAKMKGATAQAVSPAFVAVECIA